MFPGLLRAQDGRRVGLRVGLVLKVSGVIIYDVQRRFLADSSMSLGLSRWFLGQVQAPSSDFEDCGGGR